MLVDLPLDLLGSSLRAFLELLPSAGSLRSSPPTLLPPTLPGKPKATFPYGLASFFAMDGQGRFLLVFRWKPSSLPEKGV